jgi:hypothetical protein
MDFLTHYESEEVCDFFGASFRVLAGLRFGFSSAGVSLSDAASGSWPVEVPVFASAASAPEDGWAFSSVGGAAGAAGGMRAVSGPGTSSTVM